MRTLSQPRNTLRRLLRVTLAISLGAGTTAQSQAPRPTVSAGASAGGTCFPTVFADAASQFCRYGLPFAASGPATAMAQARAFGPSVFDPSDPNAYRLAQLGAASSVSTQLVSRSASGNSFSSTIISSASATYTDYLRLGPVRPASMQLFFALTGQLSIAPAFQGYASPGVNRGLYVTSSYGVWAQSGTYSTATARFDTSANSVWEREHISRCEYRGRTNVRLPIACDESVHSL